MSWSTNSLRSPAVPSQRKVTGPLGRPVLSGSVMSELVVWACGVGAGALGGPVGLAPVACVGAGGAAGPQAANSVVAVAAVASPSSRRRLNTWSSEALMSTATLQGL